MIGMLASRGNTKSPAVCVTATRLPASSLAAPYAVRELSSGQIDERLPRTLPEALRNYVGTDKLTI